MRSDNDDFNGKKIYNTNAYNMGKQKKSIIRK